MEQNIPPWARGGAEGGVGSVHLEYAPAALIVAICLRFSELQRERSGNLSHIPGPHSSFRASSLPMRRLSGCYIEFRYIPPNRVLFASTAFVERCVTASAVHVLQKEDQAGKVRWRRYSAAVSKRIGPRKLVLAGLMVVAWGVRWISCSARPG